MQVSYKLSAMVAFYYGVKNNENYSLSEGIESVFSGGTKKPNNLLDVQQLLSD